jgi:hypothetical protein
LSSFSKVCTPVRWPVERALYRDIHVPFSGWDVIHDLAHSDWRGGSLRLLLTLEGRIDLRGRVRSIQMDWYSDMDYLEEEDFALVESALRQFFSRCEPGYVPHSCQDISSAPGPLCQNQLPGGHT